MPVDSRFTSRPFTVAACCASCSPEVADVVMARLRETVRNCPHAVLVVARTLLGQVSDASMGSGQGVLLAFQPCTAERAPASPTHWIGPVCTEADAHSVCEWIADGRWTRDTLPPGLRLHPNLVRSSVLN
ncbi:hypothetical protein MMUR_64840 [Mycolicibacterium murale]|uniref:Uncharacterized protein n=1 Tax=Mycolicibacterium murale TaxID=182220 RepID=A0A7I9WY32_9MYCO|nr:hypothetical protein [Mycolicibacterium murale]MCV7182044.1 hypothetical protein [Mycolicibacterium murale]GFG62348.1 hypothetical protein MMUR_64840 [Mycolicibacterium murale]